MVGEELGATRKSQGAVGGPRGNPVEEMGEFCQGLAVPQSLDSDPHLDEVLGVTGEPRGDPAKEIGEVFLGTSYVPGVW